jgi:hypothetical protein
MMLLSQGFIHLQYLSIICMWFKIWPTPAKNHCYALGVGQTHMCHFLHILSTLEVDILNKFKSRQEVF